MRRAGRIGRLIGYALMALTMVALIMRRQGVEALGPFPITALALFLGMIGIMLVLTDMMVRGLYARVESAKEPEGAAEDSGASRPD